MTGLLPQDWDNLLNDLSTNLEDNRMNNMIKYNSKSSDNASPCDDNCKRNFLCFQKQARADAIIPC
jgi:hypothetical protein